MVGEARVTGKRPNGKGLEGGHFPPGEAAVLPVERADGGAGLGLDRPTGLGLGELEQETPVAGAPAEERLTAAPVGMPKVVFALRDAGQERGLATGHGEGFAGSGSEVADGVPRGGVVRERTAKEVRGGD